MRIMIGHRCFSKKEIMSAVKRVEFVSDRTSCTILRGSGILFNEYSCANK
jgi:hypothetical protein